MIEVQSVDGVFRCAPCREFMEAGIESTHCLHPVCGFAVGSTLSDILLDECPKCGGPVPKGCEHGFDCGGSR